jgi:hypothetical protein
MGNNAQVRTPHGDGFLSCGHSSGHVHPLCNGHAEPVHGRGSEPGVLPLRRDEAPAIATYPIRCLGVVEVLGLLGVAIAQSEPDVSGAIETFVANFTAQQPGTRHPISDRWTVSLLAPSIFLSHHIEVPCARRRTAGIAVGGVQIWRHVAHPPPSSSVSRVALRVALVKLARAAARVMPRRSARENPRPAAIAYSRPRVVHTYWVVGVEGDRDAGSGELADR